MTGYPKQYRENRARVLAGNPTCVYCGTRRATTVDHVVEVDRGGGHELENLRPACKPCNSKKGARYVNAKTKALKERAAAREVAVDEAELSRSAFFGDDAGTPRSIGRRVSPQGSPPRKVKRKPAKPTGTVPFQPDLPRLESPLPMGPTLGAEVAAWARQHLHLELMPWQRRVLDGMLTLAPGSPPDEMRLAHRHALVSVARQQGKTTALKALAGWWIAEGHRYRGGPQLVVSVAHTLDLAWQLFQELAPVLETAYNAEARWSYGRNELAIPSTGSRWLVRAATPSAGHGRSIDLVIADEIWDVSPEVIDNGLIPAQRARRFPLLAMWSTAGTEASVLMHRWREVGLSAIDAAKPGPLYFAEWSPPAGANLSDPDVWRWANPALGHTLEMETLLAESTNPNRAAFLRGSLNLWVASDHSWLEPGLWDRMAGTDPAPVPDVIAIDSAPDESRYVGVAAGVLPNGKVHVRPVFQVAAEAEAWAAVRDLMGPTTVLAVTPTLEIHTPPEIKRRTTVGYGELLKWTALVKAMVLEGRVTHDGAVALADHVARAVAVKTQAGVVLSSQRSPGPIEFARCMVWAVALASKARWTTKPAMARTRRQP